MLQKKPSVLKGEHPARQKMIFSNFFLCLWVIFSPPGSGLQIRIQEPHWIRIQFGYGSGSTTLLYSDLCVLPNCWMALSADQGSSSVMWTRRFLFFTLRSACSNTKRERINLTSDQDPDPAPLQTDGDLRPLFYGPSRVSLWSSTALHGPVLSL